MEGMGGGGQPPSWALGTPPNRHGPRFPGATMGLGTWLLKVRS